MYFSNIANEEIQHFHRTFGADFTMSLSEIIDSDLFIIEPVVLDKVYRVYPLFYCKKITSSNTDDIILDTQCLILNKITNHETYLTFKTDENKSNIKINESLLSIKGIGDALTTNEFNALIYLLRQNGQIQRNINFEQDTINGTYADYKLNNNNQVRNNLGFIINDDVKNNPLTVKLTNPFFLNAKYTLTFTVFSLTGANVCVEEYEDYKTVDTFSVVLIENQNVTIDLSSYTNDSVLDFDVDVTISFDVPEIINSDFELSLTANHNTIDIGGDVTLTATLENDDNVEGYIVSFYDNNELLDTVLTDSEGLAVLEDYAPVSTGAHVFTARTLGLSANYNVQVNKLTSSITLVANKSTAYIPTTFYINGVLTGEDGVISDADIHLYDNNTYLGKVTTNSSGEYLKENITADTVKVFNLRAWFAGDDNHYAVSSDIITVNSKKLDTSLTIGLDETSYVYDESCTISGVLTDELGTAIVGASVKLYENNNFIEDTTTVSGGQYTFTKTHLPVGSSNLKVTYDGDASHNSCNNTKQLNVYKAPSVITITNEKASYDYPESIYFTIKSGETVLTPSAVTVTQNGITHTVEHIAGNTFFEYNLNPSTMPVQAITITYAGDGNYQSCTKTYNTTVNPRVGQLRLDVGVTMENYLRVRVMAHDSATPLADFDMSLIRIEVTGAMTATITPNIGEVTDGQGYWNLDVRQLKTGNTNFQVFYDNLSTSKYEGW